MLRESDLHREKAGYVAELGRHQITVENELNDSFKKFKESQKNSNEDPSQALFKYPQTIRGMSIES